MSDAIVRTVSVSDPQRHRRGFTVYKVVSTSYPCDDPGSKTQSVVWKRFSEFQKLHKELKIRHEKLYLKDKFPAFTKSRFFGRFEADVVEERRLAALALLEFVVNHPPLYNSQTFLKFFEKSYSVLTGGDHTQDEEANLPPPLLPLPQRRDEGADAGSESSSHSTLTDTDSALSSLSSPVQQDESLKHGHYSVKVSGPCTLTPPQTPNHHPIPEKVPDNMLQKEKVIRSNSENDLPELVMNAPEPFPNPLLPDDVSHNTTSHSNMKCVPSTVQGISENIEEEDKIIIPSVFNATCSVTSTDCIGADHSTHECDAPSQSGGNSCPSSSSISADAKENSEQETVHEDASAIPDYMTQAALHVVQAVEYETTAEFEASFASYKAAIACLLGGVQDDVLEERRQLVQNKATQYLMRAEQIYHTYLAFSHSTTRTIPQATSDRHYSFTMRPDLDSQRWRSLQRAISDLKVYKVLGVVSTVILALDTLKDTPYIVKVLRKTPCPIDRRVRSVIPTNVPFMCRLHCFMENEYAVFLILEQASGGRLWDHISAYLEKRSCQGSPTAPFAQFLVGSLCEETSEETHSSEKLMLKPETGTPQNSSQDKDCLAHTSNTTPSAGTTNETSSQSSSVSDHRTLREIVSIQVEDTNKLERASDLPQEKCVWKGSTGSGIPDVVLQEPTSQPCGTCYVSNSDVPDVLLADEPCENVRDLDTSNLLENAQKLLDSVNKTLLKSEKITKTVLKNNKVERDVLLNVHEDRQTRSGIRNSIRDHKLSVSRDRKLSSSRDRKPSATRRPRAHMRFSCDDMFEGRARALSRSLDREALQKTESQSSPSLPIDMVRVWASQLLLALDALHRWGVIVGDLRPDNLLLGRGLNVILTYQCVWVCVDRVAHADAVEQLYAAPEVGSIDPITPAADWWSYGAILFELLSGETLISCHPGGLLRHTALHIPSCVPDDAANLLKQLLRYEPQDRLGAGPSGIAKLKAHPFFGSIDWHNIMLLSASV